MEDNGGGSTNLRNRLRKGEGNIFVQFWRETAIRKHSVVCLRRKTVIRKHNVIRLPSPVERGRGRGQIVGGTTQRLGGTTQHLGGTTQHLRGTTQHLRGTTQHLEGTTQHLEGTTQHLEGTTQRLGGTTQRRQLHGNTIKEISYKQIKKLDYVKRKHCGEAAQY
jgi:hypothetical protein